MTPNGNTWNCMDEKVAVVSTTRFDRIRKNKLLLALIAFGTCMLMLIAAAGAIIYYFYIPQAKKSALLENSCDKMLCLFGSQCRVNQSNNRAYCHCAEVCSDIFAPVCGDNGVTYSNECQLRLFSCTQQRRIFVVKHESCDTRDPCERKDCQFGSICKVSVTLDGKSARCICPENCISSGSEQNPVCGTDGKNYRNPCDLKRASCREMRLIEVKFHGVCDPCDGVECPTSQTCQLDENRNAMCRCNSVCSPDFRPVCGSDGKTYTNECTLRVEACKSRKNIRIIYTGECSSGANPCDSLQCGPYQSCDIDRHGKATCHCDELCEPVVRLVCGSDGETYTNECEMKKQGCIARKTIKLAYRGECGERGVCYKYHCSNGAICVVKGGFPYCECPTCTEEFEPVCGTDGISYTNKCKLQRESCEQKSEIAVAYSGLCNGCENKRCEYYAVCESDGRGNGKCVCPQSCIKVESPVCGTDEITYLNECEMRVEACRKAQYVMVVSKGPCDLCQNVHCKYGARCEDGRCVCPTECPNVSETVCANDGMTYENECQMRHAACIHDQELNMLFYGECDDVGESQDEGSGAEIDCEERTCKYGGICEYNMDGLPHCACNFQCPLSLDPVCGSDGKLYDNECKLKEESCNQQKSIMPVHIEMCEEFREVPCDGEVPLLDPATNKDYFCGEGLGSKLCPPGSYCHKSSAFSKCCREIILIKTCSESIYGCCPDGKTAAQGPHNAGCPSICNCNRLGSYGLTCDPISKQCFCKPGVGGPHCDRCEPGYWGLHRITDDSNDGCTPCTCNMYGSVRDDCEQMTGRCVCKQGIQGMKCDICPEGTVLSPEGCMDESIALPISGSCDQLMCFHGARCKEIEENHAQCICDIICTPEDNKEIVCGSDGNTYASECQMKLFSCRYQKIINVVSRKACVKDPRKKHERKPPVLKRSMTDRILSYITSGGKQSLRKSPVVPNNSSHNRYLKNLYQKKEKTSLSDIKINGSHLSITIEFFPTKPNGVILFCEGISKNSSIFLLLHSKDRFVELWLKYYNETIVLKLQKQIKIGTLQNISIILYKNSVALYLDNNWKNAKYYAKSYPIPHFPSETKIEFHSDLQKRLIKGFPQLSNFVGCINRLQIQHKQRNLLLVSTSCPQRFKKNLPNLNEVNNDSWNISTDDPDSADISSSSITKGSSPLFSWIIISPEYRGNKFRNAMKSGKMRLVCDVQEEIHNEITSSENIALDKFHDVKIEMSKARICIYVDSSCKLFHVKGRISLENPKKCLTYLAGNMTLELNDSARLHTIINFHVKEPSTEPNIHNLPRKRSYSIS